MRNPFRVGSFLRVQQESASASVTVSVSVCPFLSVFVYIVVCSFVLYVVPVSPSTCPCLYLTIYLCMCVYLLLPFYDSQYLYLCCYSLCLSVSVSVPTISTFLSSSYFALLSILFHVWLPGFLSFLVYVWLSVGRSNCLSIRLCVS